MNKLLFMFIILNKLFALESFHESYVQILAKTPRRFSWDDLRAKSLILCIIKQIDSVVIENVMAYLYHWN